MRSKSKDFFESIGEFPYNIGIYLTYTLDTVVIEKLTEYATGTILILHDYSQGKILEYNRDSRIICLPVNTLLPHQQNCFHSKLVLLKADERAKLIVGSVNLSTDSFSSEKEIAFEKELKFDNSEDVFLYKQVLTFFEKIGEQVPVSKDIFKNTLKKLKYPNLTQSTSDIEFVYNSKDKSIFDCLGSYIKKNRRDQKAKSIKIATPFVSDKYKAIEDFKKISPNISVYLRNGAKIEPFKQNGFKVFQPIKGKRSGFHAKLVLIEYKSDALLFIGSANFTEQGFFQNANQSSNQECGIILKTSKNEMNYWFDEKLWTQMDIENYKVNSDDNSTEWIQTGNEFYAWAITENNKIITHIYNPEKLQVIQDGKKINLQTIDENLNLFKTEKLKVKDKEQNIIKFEIGGKEIKIAVFELEEFNAANNKRNESIFYSFGGISSVNPKEVDEAIDKEKISIPITTTKINITEPPKLEQYYYNVKNLCKIIKNKKYFSEYNEREIKEELRKTNDGRSMYLALKLYKIFWHKPNTENISLLCRKRIDELSNELVIDQHRLNKFIKEWLTSKT